MAVDPNDRVRSLVGKKTRLWQGRLGLDHWKIDNYFLEAFDPGQWDRPVNMVTTAHTEAMPQYLHAKIFYYLPSAASKDDERLEEVVVHELVHVLLSPEQALIDTRTAISTAADRFADPERDALQAANMREVELSTELTTRALMKAWSKKDG